ncbi:phage tail collar domain-containing protein (plasmid) [Tistrella mobilis KA081020-065]|uniref:Phage tail collar domain-containing protein n=1 Tax=Tistrella mobilis (strain KA081020-065) TaxID=1110502 RepID=I3TXM3_TISMK|nr:phage tail collar domain-containing protein [Tistrella mobilis KA081020-065]
MIGTTYGGDGVETFALPDLRGRRWTGADAATHPVGGALGRCRPGRHRPGQCRHHRHGPCRPFGFCRADGRFLAPAIEGGLAVLPAGGGVPVPLGAPWLAATAIIRATL